MKKLILLLSFLPLWVSGQQRSNVGDIEFNPETDNKDFLVCNKNYIHQYFNMGEGLEYEGEKLELIKEFNKAYKSEVLDSETGLIRINFVVNCKGETGRFRLIAMDENYEEKEFDKSITDQLFQITKGLTGWKRKMNSNYFYIDYYQYLIFKIEKGQLKEILP